MSLRSARRSSIDGPEKWPQRIPFSRSTVVTFGGPKFLTLQITSTRKRKSAVYGFVCGQSETKSALSACEFNADEARSKDSSNPFSSPLDFTAPIIISARAETARSVGRPSVPSLESPKIKIASCPRLFHQRYFTFEECATIKCPID